MLKYVLQGRWIGHSLHSMIMHLPLGLLALSLLFDIVSRIHPDHVFVSASLMSMSLAIVAALVAMAPGLADFFDIRADRPASKIAALYMIPNLVAATLYVVNIAIRWFETYTPSRGSVPIVPLILSMLGLGILSFSGYLGGLFVHDDWIDGQRQHKTAEQPRETIFVLSQPGEEWIQVAPANLQDGETLRASIDGQITAIIKDHGEYFAVQGYCTHRCGPLSEGACRDGKIVCPLHGSQFDLRSGEVMKGPAKQDLKTWEVCVRDGQIAVRVRPANASVSLGPIWRSEAERQGQQI